MTLRVVLTRARGSTDKYEEQRRLWGGAKSTQMLRTREGGGPDAVRRARVQALRRSRVAFGTRWGSLCRVPCVACAYGTAMYVLCCHAHLLLLAELALNHGLLSLDFSLDVDALTA